MVYQNNIPQPTDRPSNSQADLLGNFQDLKTYLDRNHVAIANPGADPDEGKHNFMQMPEQGAGPATAANEGALYTKQSALSTVTELFFRRESSGTEIEFTSSLGATDGWTRLPSGILLKWGRSSGTGISTTNFPVAATIPVFTAVYNGFVCIEDTAATPNTFVTFRSITTTSITIYGSRRTTTAATAAVFRYLVIGI